MSVSPAYAADRTFFAGTFRGGVLRSTDGGGAWQAVNNSLVDRNVLSVAVSPGYAADRTVFAGTSGGGVYSATEVVLPPTPTRVPSTATPVPPTSTLVVTAAPFPHTGGGNGGMPSWLWPILGIIVAAAIGGGVFAISRRRS